MDLNLDVLNKRKDQMTIALSHYYKHPSGDMIADPDMEIRVNRKDYAFIEALTYQDGYIYQEVYLDKYRYSPELKNQLNDFLSQWLKNCIDQGHCLKRRNFKK